jgi:Fur family ferric uptake transcriptional regulator
MSCEEAFIKQLRERGFRLTPQREMVLSIMHQLEDFASVEEIYERVQALSTSVDVSTVYRTLDLLQDFHLVTCVDPIDGQRRYRLVGNRGPHLHMVCSACGAVEGVDLEPARPLADQVEATYGFRVDLNELTLPGLCRKCRKAQPESHVAGESR